MDEELEIVRGKDARRLMENPLLNEALDAIMQRYRDEIENSQLSQQTLREEAFRMLCSVKLFRQHLTSFLNTGKLASTAKAQRQENEVRERRLAEWDGSPDGQPRI